MIYRPEKEQDKFARQLIAIAVALSIVIGGGYLLSHSDAPYHPEVTRGQSDLLSLD